MAYINIAEWTAKHVAEWLEGLDDAILPYAHFFINNNIDGRHLLTLLPDDLIHLNIIKIGHQELILDAVDLLRQLHYTLTTETLQSLALRVGCKARSLYNDLKRNVPQDENAKQERVSVNILSSVSDILIAVKVFASWLDRYPFDGESQYAPVRRTVLKHSIELASTAQRDQFADKPHQTIKDSCLNLAELCDKIIQEFNDSLIIQPASLDIVTVKRKPEEELGMHIHSSYSGVHIVGGVKYQSPSHRCGKVEIGDEIVQVNYQTVVGWQLKKLVYTMKEYPTELHLTLKKRPRHFNLLGQVIIMKPFRIPSRETALARLHSDSCLQLKDSPPVRRNVPISIDEIEDEDDSAFLPDGVAVTDPIIQNLPIIHYPLFPVKNRATVQRRATVSGASPTVTRPPVSIKDLVAGVPSLSKELVGRSVSHDPSNRARDGENRPILKPIPSDIKEDVSVMSNGKGRSGDPAWLSPRHEEEEEPSILENKSLEFTSSLQQQGATKEGANSHQVTKNVDNRGSITEDSQHKPTNITPSKESTEVWNPSQSNSALQGKPVPQPIPNKQMFTSNFVSNIISHKSHMEAEKPSDLLEESSSSKHSMPVIMRKTGAGSGSFSKSCRRVSVKELGLGDNQGWIYKRKEGKRLFSGPKWVKRWAVLKGSHLYLYANKDEIKAECLVNLTGFIVSPAPDCKAKKYAFKLFSTNISLLLATDNRTDMTIWMNKMCLVAISYSNSSKLPSGYGQASEPLYSETEDEAEDVNPQESQGHHLLPNQINLCSNESLYTSSILLPSQKTVSEASRRITGKSLNSQTEGLSPTSPAQQPAVNLKFNYHKPTVKPRSPQRTVAERPLERTVIEAEIRKASPKPKTTTPRTKCFSGTWTPESSPVSLPVTSDSNPLNRSQQMMTTYTLPNTTITSPNAGTHFGNQHHITQVKDAVHDKQYDSSSLPPPLHPRGVKPNNSPSANIAQKNPYSRHYKSNSNIQRCASLQKLSSSEIASDNLDHPPVSMLDREYHRLYGKKKPETISPQTAEEQRDSPDSTRSSGSWWNSSVPRTATSQEIHSLYTSQDSWKSPSDVESLPDSSCGSVFSDVNVTPNSIDDEPSDTHYSPITPLTKEAPKLVHGGHQSLSNLPSCSSAESGELYSSSKFSIAKQFSPKSPNSSFRFFSSPKFVRKFSSPKQDRKHTPSQLKLPKHVEDVSILSNSPKTERKFLGSPKLARAIFRSPKHSPKETKTTTTTTTTGVQTEHTFDELVRLHQQNSASFKSDSCLKTTNLYIDKELENSEERIKSSSNSSLNSNGSAVSSSGSPHYYVEARFRPQITVSLPLVTEAGDDCASCAGGPHIKPTMGVSMLSKRRSPSTSSDRVTTDPPKGSGADIQVQEETGDSAQRSEFTMLINTQEGPLECFSEEKRPEPDDLGNLILALKSLFLTPVGEDVRLRRHYTMLKPSQDPRTSELVLSLRAFQRTLADREKEAAAIEELFSSPITSQRLEEWICCYPHLLPPDYC